MTVPLLEQSYVIRGNRVLPASIKSILQGDTKVNLRLRHGDIVYLPSASTARVYVLGQVNAAGAIPYRPEMSLVEAIAESGGLTDDAKDSMVRVFRGDLHNPRCYTVTLCDAMKAGSAVRLHPGDRVFVGTSEAAKYAKVFALVSPLLQTASLAAVTAQTFGN